MRLNNNYKSQKVYSEEMTSILRSIFKWDRDCEEGNSQSLKWTNNTSSAGLSDCRVRWACGGAREGEREGVAKTILGPMKTEPALINTGRPLFLLAARRQTFWPALDDAWSKIGHHTAQQWSQWWHHHSLQCALPSVLLRTKSSRHAAREADVTLCLGNIKTNKCSPSPEKGF